MRAVFVASIDQQANTRVQMLAKAGIRSTIFVHGRLAADPVDLSNAYLMGSDQGLQWYDVSHSSVALQGLTPGAPAPLSEGQGEVTVGNRTFNTVVIPITNPRTRQYAGLLRASESNEQQRAAVRWMDTGLLVGTMLAILGGGVGGLALARRAVRPVALTFATLREFTADASHELRGPLTAIAGNADAALRDLERDPSRDHARFEAIADGARQMSRLTSDLLLLAGAERPIERELFVVDMAAVLNGLRARYEQQFAAAGISLRVVVGEAAVVIYGNPVQIERTLANLLENALRYTEAGGAVLVEGSRDRTQVLITVRDTGIGIAPEHIDRIFDRFWRVDSSRSQGGSGLGLAIARALARRHGGDVTVTSRSDVGSEFVATFPTRPQRVD